MKIISAALVLACGFYELSLATSVKGEGWQFIVGIVLVAYSVLRGYYAVLEYLTKAKLK